MLEVATDTVRGNNSKKMKCLVTKYLFFDSENGELIIQLDDNFTI